jgi:hypothetical protein
METWNGIIRQVFSRIRLSPSRIKHIVMLQPASLSAKGPT